MLGKGFGGFFPLSVGGFTTFFPDLRKPSLDTLLGKGLKLRGPHSLGTLIEWKPCISITSYVTTTSPHSLGTLIEWKQNAVLFNRAIRAISPHSLGTLIEWKLYVSQLLQQ